MANDKNKTKDQLLKEISELRRRIAELEKSEAEHKRAEARAVQPKMKPAAADRESDRRIRDANVFCQMGAKLQGCETLGEAYKVVERFGPDLFPAITGALFITSGVGKNMEAVAAWGGDLQSERLFPPEQCETLIHGQAVFAEPSTPGKRCKHMNPSFSGSYLDLPMTASGEIIGLLHLESRYKTYDRKAEELALIVAEHLTLSLSNLKLREAFSEEAVRDPLTGLFNKRYMEESLAQELARASRATYPVSILKLTVDNFEHFSDAFGRDGGDSLLKELGSLLQGQVRRGDISARVGEDFVLILPNAKPEFAVKRAQGLKEMVKHLNVVFQGRSLGPITISVGVAAYPDSGASADELLQTVEQALSHAKTKGRDVVEFAAGSLKD